MSFISCTTELGVPEQTPLSSQGGQEIPLTMGEDPQQDFCLQEVEAGFRGLLEAADGG